MQSTYTVPSMAVMAARRRWACRERLAVRLNQLRELVKAPATQRDLVADHAQLQEVGAAGFVATAGAVAEAFSRRQVEQLADKRGGHQTAAPSLTGWAWRAISAS